MSMLDRAIVIAAEAHVGQIDKGGQPYILHPLRVMLAMHDEVDRVVAVLHDVAEDCPAWPVSRLLAEGFGEEICDAVAALTRKRRESYEAFIVRVGRNAIARRVKLADIADNSDVSRLGRVPTPADRERLDRYWRAMTALSRAEIDGRREWPEVR